jgi:hypothetical protein
MTLRPTKLSWICALLDNTVNNDVGPHILEVLSVMGITVVDIVARIYTLRQFNRDTCTNPLILFSNFRKRNRNL